MACHLLYNIYNYKSHMCKRQVSVQCKITYGNFKYNMACPESTNLQNQHCYFLVLCLLSSDVHPQSNCSWAYTHQIATQKHLWWFWLVLFGPLWHPMLVFTLQVLIQVRPSKRPLLSSIDQLDMWVLSHKADQYRLEARHCQQYKTNLVIFELKHL